MEKIIPFLTRHWILAVLLIIVFAVIVVVESVTRALSPQSIKPQEAINFINRENAVVIDLRDRGAFRAGHIIQAQNIPLAELPANLAKIVAYKDRPIILVCHSGQNAIAASKQLAAQGLKSVRILAGGMQGWRSAGFPVEK